MLRSKTRPVFALPDMGQTATNTSIWARTARLWRAYILRQRRRRFLLRAFRKRRDLRILVDNTAQIAKDALLAFVTVRNEAARLPYFLDHHRALGVEHFLFVVNDSTDTTAQLLGNQPDVSVWTTKASYKDARFGMDWLNHLLARYGHGHWCLTLDADELFAFDGDDTTTLTGLAAKLDAQGHTSFGALMVDLYPKGPLDAGHYQPGQDPVEVIPYFDATGYRATYRTDMQNLWLQGGVRDRVFFADRPERAPTLSKVPFVKWNRRYTYVSSTHTLLPRRLNHVYDHPTGALLHTKFLPGIVDKSREEAQRREHFADADVYQAYYRDVIAAPDLWSPSSQRYTGSDQLTALGLITPFAPD